MGLLSKCIAGGFSAGVVLLWWPLLVPGDSLTAWLSRGVAFTLAFELLLLGLRPLEHALWATRGGTRLRMRLDGVAARVTSGDTVRHLGSTAVLAAVAVAVPAALIAAGLQERPAKNVAAKRPAPPRVVRITKVVRPVKVQRVVEAPPVVTTPAPTPAPSAPVRSKPTTKTTPAKKKATPERQASEKVATPKKQPDTQDTQDEATKPAAGSSTGTQPQLG